MTIGTGIALAAMWGAVGCIGVFGGGWGRFIALVLGVCGAEVMVQVL